MNAPHRARCPEPAMTLLGRRVGSGRTSPSGARAYGLLVKRSAGLGTINIRYKALKHTTLHAHIQHFTHTPGMRIDTGLSAVLWSSIPATASIVAPQERNGIAVYTCLLVPVVRLCCSGFSYNVYLVNTDFSSLRLTLC